jgi:DNA-binding HxlR family transcriptional regulator
MVSGRIYPHFCMMARALEEVGERWSLLIVRDLLLGPRRFTDLAHSLGGITPTRLTDRLRSLESAGIVVREPAESGREVWYRLTAAGQDLAPVLDELALWGVQHAFDPPERGEPVHPDHVMQATRVWLERYGQPPSAATSWVWDFPGVYSYTLEYGRGQWTLARGGAEGAAVTVSSTAETWARFLTRPDKRRLPGGDIQLTARAVAAKAFARAFGAKLDSASVRRPAGRSQDRARRG